MIRVWKGLFVLVLGILCLPNDLMAQEVQRVEPPNWWVGMKNPNLQVMIQQEGIGSADIELSGKNVALKAINKAENPDFVFVDLEIAADAPAQILRFGIRQKGKKKQWIEYGLKARTNAQLPTVNGSDVIYLITPDRFVNGDLSNDTVEGMKEAANRDFHGGRHGGDLAGIISKVPYMEELGITTVWSSPVLENDMPAYSYHGYAITDFYEVDPRFGSNEQYRELSDVLHARKMKLVMDMVFNHCGLDHWWMTDKPFADWVHDYEEYGITNYAISAYTDPYRTQQDRDKMEKGWFVPSMPDLNHDNPFMAQYLIQNSIWWIEYANLDGIRMDTHPYNQPKVMKQWADAVRLEYPGFYLLGETWVGQEALEAYWSPRKENASGFDSGLTSVTDFPLCFAMQEAFKPEGDVRKLYEVLSLDYLYDLPATNTIFADNHDMDRFYHSIGKDLSSFKLAMTFMLTTRGIPQLYYGTEVLMDRFGDHGILRQDFDGGWPSDSLNAFDVDQLTGEVQEAGLFLRQALKIRKENPALQSGQLKHYMPQQNLYAYQRKLRGEAFIVLLNNSQEEIKIDWANFSEIVEGRPSGVDLLSNQAIDFGTELLISAKTPMIIRLKETKNSK